MPEEFAPLVALCAGSGLWTHVLMSHIGGGCQADGSQKVRLA